MGSLTHKAARTAAGIGIDQALKKVTRGDREAELLKLIDLAEKYTSGTNLSIDFTSCQGRAQAGSRHHRGAGEGAGSAYHRH